ncbi:helix-hairpin-helix domain-containing protein [Tindallia californiensis]|uniref:Competence protein ComEA n=1 Tax=Tindallia californiensis TaxID=159292 RepID=A0A1H3NEG3_9FIRM|nr:helix-hairpin-helix domain-containing protein [Tindallia californiensis]SDY86855.1 competence protein ComEA [Tindallia californiensis]
MELTKKQKISLLAIAVIIFTYISVREVMYLRSKTYILTAPSEMNHSVESVEMEHNQNEDSFFNKEDAISESTYIMVHIEGEVNKPGVYELAEGSRVVDVVDKAGGLTSSANRRIINKAQKLTDEMFILIPHIDEEVHISFAERVDHSSSGELSTPNDGMININTADVKLLETLPGIGPVLAQRIVDYRNQHGKFNHADDLMNVAGIGEGRYKDISDQVTVR